MPKDIILTHFAQNRNEKCQIVHKIDFTHTLSITIINLFLLEKKVDTTTSKHFTND